MTQLELIWRLEKHFTLLEEYKSNLDILKKDVSLRNLEVKHKKNEENRLGLITLLEKKKELLVTKEKKLKNTSFNYKEIEMSLYSGSITDFKQLDHLSEERKSIELLIKNTENEIIELMLEIDDIISNIESMDMDISNLEQKLKETKKKLIYKATVLDKGITRESNKIDEYSNKIAKELLSKYINIRKKKKYGIVKIVENICTGCNMVISSYDFEKVKNDNEIVYCEQCGRILYYQKLK
jgi:predicted  nucleic acid-binding Zn-ribbon protein